MKGVQIFNPTSSPVNMFFYDVFSGDTVVSNPTAVDAEYKPIEAKNRFTLCWDLGEDEASSSCILNPGQSMVLSSCSVTSSAAMNALALKVPGVLAASPSYNSVTGDDWLVLGLLETSTGSYTVVDVIGDYNTATSVSYSGIGSDGVEVATNDAGIKRVKTLASFPVPRTSWDTTEWTFQETDITGSSTLDYMKYHFADMFECTQDSDCPADVPSVCDITLKQCVETTNAPTDAPTQAPTTQPTQAPTNAPTPTAEYVCKHENCNSDQFCSKLTSACEACSMCDLNEKANDDRCPVKCSPIMFTSYIEVGMNKVRLAEYSTPLLSKPQS